MVDLGEQRQRDAALPEVTAVLEQDVADLKAVGIERTPTFFVNGKEPSAFGPQPLYEAIVAEIGRTDKES